MTPTSPRNDIKPVILGGDWSTYSLARQFFEAFGVVSTCIAPGAVAVIEHSKFINMHVVSSMADAEVLAAIIEIASKNADKKLILVANTDDRIMTVENIREQLPANVLLVLPPHEVARQVSDKVSFAELCERYGLLTPPTETVSLAGSAPIPPSQIDFPLIAKPAVSSDYVHLFAKGFQKVYFIHEQAELDQLWNDLREVGFEGDFLVQKLIEGDDCYMDSITLYADSAGKVTLFASAHVILEDHVPALFGNPVAMITKPMPEVWEKLARMLSEIGWHGFANIDLKRDPHTGEQYFLDFNPRIGSNSYYVCAGGTNPMYVLVRDIVDGVSDEVFRVEKNILYTRVPPTLARRYITDPQLLAEFDKVVAAGEIYNPTRCKADSFSSRAYGKLMEQNYIKKFRQYYPKPTKTSF